MLDSELKKAQWTIRFTRKDAVFWHMFRSQVRVFKTYNWSTILSNANRSQCNFFKHSHTNFNCISDSNFSIRMKDFLRVTLKFYFLISWGVFWIFLSPQSTNVHTVDVKNRKTSLYFKFCKSLTTYNNQC